MEEEQRPKGEAGEKGEPGAKSEQSRAEEKGDKPSRVDKPSQACIVLTDNLVLRELILSHFAREDVRRFFWKPGEAPAEQQVADGAPTPFHGPPAERATFSLLGPPAEGLVFVSFPDEQENRQIGHAIRDQLPNYSVLIIRQEPVSTDPVVREEEEKLEEALEDGCRWVHLDEIFAERIGAEIDHLRNRQRVARLRSQVEGHEKVAILLQNDPDPDGIASAFALRVLLGRNRQTTPILTLGRVTRPENLAMLQLLDLEVESVTPEQLLDYPKRALVDVQPPALFRDDLPDFQMVIDHHPITREAKSTPYQDIRVRYGATSTILTEYLLAEGIAIHQRLATALLYGIKSDTLMLNREVSPADLKAFMHLYPLINYTNLRRMERPELPFEFAEVLRKALGQAAFHENIVYVHLGRLEREDLVPQMADFFLQFKGADWALVSGTWEKHWVCSVRNTGLVQHSGETVKKLFGAIGSAGGHRTMAKAVVPISDMRKMLGGFSAQLLHKTIPNLWWEALQGEEEGESAG